MSWTTAKGTGETVENRAELKEQLSKKVLKSRGECGEAEPQILENPITPPCPGRVLAMQGGCRHGKGPRPTVLCTWALSKFWGSGLDGSERGRMAGIYVRGNGRGAGVLLRGMPLHERDGLTCLIHGRNRGGRKGRSFDTQRLELLFRGLYLPTLLGLCSDGQS